MSYKRCCIPGCSGAGSENVLHEFPNPAKDLDHFMIWVHSIGGDILKLTNKFICKNRRVCRLHFEAKYHCRFNRLSNIAVPTINMHYLHSSDPIVQTPPRQLQNLLENMPSVSYASTDHTSAISTEEPLGVKTTIIYPATDKHIAKYSQQETHIILETPELYNKFTLPHLEKEQFNLQWVYNILEGKSEQDRVVYNNKCDKEGFVLLPDLKWDGLTKETLYLLAIVRQRGLKSLRDLCEGHLPLLKRVRDEGKKAILDKYKVPGSQLRIYLHYQPSFYHLHIHFTYLKHEAPGIYAEKSHLLDTVIDNIEMMSSYYQKATLPFTIREMDTLFNVYETNGYIKRIKDIELIDK